MLAAVWISQASAATVQTLGLMGFDVDRSHLIAALTFGAVAAAVAAFVGGSLRVAALLGPVGWLAFFIRTLNDETVAALRASGIDGTFDPLGWSFSILTFVVMALFFGWAAATLAVVARRGLGRSLRRLRLAFKRHSGRTRATSRLASAAVATTVLVACFTLFSQMIDFTPDVAFVQGGSGHVSLTNPGDDLPTLPPGATEPPPRPTPSLKPGETPGPTPGPEPPIVQIEKGGTLQVWPGSVALLPAGHFGAITGTSTTETATLPAPWTGGFASTVTVYVRLPIGYDATKRYPTIYETPQTYAQWTTALRLGFSVDALETAGEIPPMIYVFAAPDGGPYAVTQCIDSYDGLEKWDTFMSTTLVEWVDAHYPTIAKPAARTIMGSSQGAFCSADLLARHPDVWLQEISFDGFYDAAPRNPRTAGGGEAFGGDGALMDQYSPVLLVTKLPEETRQKMFFVLVGLSEQDFFGDELDRFSTLLNAYGYGQAVIQSPFGHSWKTPEAFLPRALSLIAGRLVLQGVVQ